MTNDKSQNQQSSDSQIKPSEGRKEDVQQGQHRETAGNEKPRQGAVPDQNETLKDAHSIGYGRSSSGLDSDDTGEE